MSTTIYDSSLLTQRRKQKAESGNYINSVANNTNPNVTYTRPLGILDQSIINDIKSGQMVYYRKSNGIIAADNGCPCALLPNTGCNTN
jgi:hypothetical protein